MFAAAKKGRGVVPQLKSAFDLSKRKVDIMPKCAAALDVLAQLRIGSAYDYLYQNPLQYLSVYKVPKCESFRSPYVIDMYGRESGTVGCMHPKFYLQGFKLDCVSWFTEDHWDPRKSDCDKYDTFSEEYVILWGNRKNWNKGSTEHGTLSVGVSHLGKGLVQVNSFRIDYWIRGEHRGHPCILLPRE